MTPAGEKEIAFPNPDGYTILEAWREHRDQFGDIWDAARAAGVRATTITQWVRRRKIEPVLSGDGDVLFHLPTIITASKNPVGRPRKAA